MSVLRPLPSRPSLEFERKEAKALLRRLRAGDPEALERARERHAVVASTPVQVRLADAQLVIAREYGFTSWPKLVQYFGDLERQSHNRRSIPWDRRDLYEQSARSLVAQHGQRRASAVMLLGAYVPRFYGMRREELFASAVTEDEARLAVARSNGFPSWESLLESVATKARRREDDWEVPSGRDGSLAIEAGDLPALQRLTEAYPELLRPSAEDLAMGKSLLRTALHHERRKGGVAMRPIIEWLVGHGFDVQRELNRQLCGHMRMKTEKVRWLLERGADANWVSPNGFPVLEHAIMRYWNGEAVDLVAARTRPRRALWIAAGLGDVEGVGRFLDPSGRPKAEARKLRPDFDAVSPRMFPRHPDPEDEEILMEAFVVAMLNDRTAVLEYMTSRGFNVNTLVWESPPINMAVGNAMVSVVESLVRCGANLDLRGWHPQQSAREMARGMFEDDSKDSGRRRIVELCGMDPDAVLAERDARPTERPGAAAKLQEALELAGDDAFRRGQTDIRPENLLFGLLRAGGLPVLFFTKVSGIDFERFRADVWDRVRPDLGRVERPQLALDLSAQAVMQAAIGAATERRRQMLTTVHVLYVLMLTDDGVAAELLTRYGANVGKLRAEMEGSL